MGRIRILDPVTANKIAAGEVVERPAAVVKELIENSLDAEASRIEIYVEKGGMRLIRVVDDGCGMSARDVANALERHATSKIEREETCTQSEPWVSAVRLCQALPLSAVSACFPAAQAINLEQK